MKKLLSIIAIAFSLAIQAQSLHLNVSNSVTTATNQTISGIVGWVSYPANPKGRATGQVNASVVFYKDTTCFLMGYIPQGFSPVIPIDGNKQPIQRVNIQLSYQQITGGNTDLVINQVVADSLQSKYGWSVNVVY